MRLLVCFFAVAGPLAGCAPIGEKGDSCEDGPCAVGLVCNDDLLCDDPPPPPPPPCESDAECPLDGDTSGRVCLDGVCGFADCALDAQCGNRICVDGSCAPRVPCLNDGQCPGGDLCVDNACRPPCAADADCGLNIGGFGLNTCVDGRCTPRCLNDATCIGGGICENNICIDEECVGAVDCGDGNVLCNAGRCDTFTPCARDGDCFDPNLFCDLEAEPVRCAERPLCRSDAACGIDGICLDGHCRDATGCFVDDDCPDVDECIGGRCVRQPLCRGEGDCDAGQLCIALRCVAATDPVIPAAVDIADAVGTCAAPVGCGRVAFVGETIGFFVQGYDAEGLPVDITVDAASDNDATATVVVTGVRATIATLAAGRATVTIAGVNVDVVVVEPAAVSDLVVAVVDDGGVAAGATVVVDGVEFVADADGVVRFSPAPAASTVSARGRDGRGVVIVGDTNLEGSWRLPLPAPAVGDGAPLAVTVTSTGDEVGPVGLGLVIPSVEGPAALSLTRLLGDVINASIEVPVVGALPVGLPSSMSLEATLPLVGQQVIRARAETLVAPGPAFVLALEDRREQNTVFNLALGGDPIAFALELLGDAETVDALVTSVGTIDDRADVADVDDRDGDGNVDELVTDFAGADVIDVRPAIPPQERSAVTVTLPGDATDGLIVAGFTLPGRLVPAGASIVRRLENFEGVPLSDSFKVVPASLAFARAGRFVAVVSVFVDDALSSRTWVTGATLPSSSVLGAMLEPPTGARVVEGLPGPGERAVLMPALDGADLVRLRLVDGPNAVDVYAGPRTTVTLPAAFVSAAATLTETESFQAGGLATLQAGDGPQTVDAIAVKAARAPGG